MLTYLISLLLSIWAIFTTINDVPEPWVLSFQDNATPQMEGLEELHNNIMFYLALVLFAVSWIMLSIILNYRKAKISSKYVKFFKPVLIFTITFVSALVFIFFSWTFLHGASDLMHMDGETAQSIVRSSSIATSISSTGIGSPCGCCLDCVCKEVVCIKSDIVSPHICCICKNPAREIYDTARDDHISTSFWCITCQCTRCPNCW